MASSSQPPPLNPRHPSPPPATPTSPPTSTTTSTTTTTQTNPISPHPPASTTNSSLSSPRPPPGPAPHHPPPSTANSTLTNSLPTPQSTLQISEARAAVLASIGNMLDASLRDRASVLHSNAAAIAKQERDVARATDALRRENDRLARVAGDAAKKVKELGNVQNWAEVLESDFLALEETLRLVREGSTDGGSWSGSGSGSWSGSESGGDDDGDVRMAEPGEASGKVDKGKGKEVDVRVEDAMDVDGAEGTSGQTLPLVDGSGTGNTAMNIPDVHLPAVQSTSREAPSIKVPGLEPSQTSTISLEDELRIAMDQTIGTLS